MFLTLAVALLPACDFTIREAADWTRVNDPDKTVICVAPAPTYTYEQVGIVQLSASGTADQPRWLRWSNDDEAVHPALVPAMQTAAISQFDLTGSHWIIDRLVVRDAIYQPRVMGSSNTLRRMVFEKPRAWEGRPIGLMLHFTSGSDNAVVNSVFREPFRAKGIDSYAIYIHEAERITVQGNEFINLVDGVSNGPQAGAETGLLTTSSITLPPITPIAGVTSTRAENVLVPKEWRWFPRARRTNRKVISSATWSGAFRRPTRLVQVLAPPVSPLISGQVRR